jgi:hypothetical protein
VREALKIKSFFENLKSTFWQNITNETNTDCIGRENSNLLKASGNLMVMPFFWWRATKWSLFRYFHSKMEKLHLKKKGIPFQFLECKFMKLASLTLGIPGPVFMCWHNMQPP